MTSRSEFAQRVAGIVAALEPGELVTYGEVAAEAGRPGAARAVGRILADSQGLPWWRVVRADGSLPMGERQAVRLEEEGVGLIGDGERFRISAR